MKEIGITSYGSVIVEMSLAELKALRDTRSAPTKATAAPKPDPATMDTTELVAFVKEGIVKLKPKKRDGVVHSIAAMFQFNGGLTEVQNAKSNRPSKAESVEHYARWQGIVLWWLSRSFNSHPVKS